MRYMDRRKLERCGVNTGKWDVQYANLVGMDQVGREAVSVLYISMML